GAVTREVDAGNLTPVLLDEALGVAVDAAQHSRPRPLDDEVAGVHRLALVVDDVGVDAGEREGRGARLADRDPRQRADEDLSRFRLPPGIDDRTATVADHLPVPHPGLGVDRLTDGPEQPERGKIAALGKFLAPSNERADGRRRRVEDGHAVLLDDAPEAILLGEV